MCTSSRPRIQEPPPPEPPPPVRTEVDDLKIGRDRSTDRRDRRGLAALRISPNNALATGGSTSNGVNLG